MTVGCMGDGSCGAGSLFHFLNIKGKPTGRLASSNFKSICCSVEKNWHCWLLNPIQFRKILLAHVCPMRILEVFTIYAKVSGYLKVPNLILDGGWAKERISELRGKKLAFKYLSSFYPI